MGLLASCFHSLVGPSIQATACNKVPPRASAHAHAHLQEDLASLLTDMRRARMPAAAVQHVATMLGMEGRQPPKAAEGATPVSLEALRLQDPAAMSGCWNPGCAAVLALAGWWRTLDIYLC